MPPEPSTASRLCAACGMCCNGVLFHAGVLQEGDSERALSALGLKIKRRGSPPHFLQPCTAHRDSHCTIYDQRPQRCRLFNCRQLLRVATGDITESAALEKIHEAKSRTARVENLIDRLAETNPRRALAQRCANALTGTEANPLHAELKSAMSELEALLKTDFRVE
ncbi:MAG: YkgJ family cysteine cluster protein [Chthoniobacterales bacterium]